MIAAITAAALVGCSFAMVDRVRPGDARCRVRPGPPGADFVAVIPGALIALLGAGLAIRGVGAPDGQPGGPLSEDLQTETGITLLFVGLAWTAPFALSASHGIRQNKHCVAARRAKASKATGAP